MPEDPMYQLLRNEDIESFNQRKAAGDACDMTGCDFRGLDLRGLDASNLDFNNAYFRGADIRGIDFRTSKLDGVSIANAKISGTYFPKNIDANEILLSLTHGIRMRCG